MRSIQHWVYEKYPTIYYKIWLTKGTQLHITLTTFTLYFYLAILTATLPCGDVKPRTKKSEHLKTLSAITTLFNAKSQTYLDPSRATYSAIDLTLSDLGVFLYFYWRFYEDICGSGYFLIAIESVNLQAEDLPRWKLNQDNWE